MSAKAKFGLILATVIVIAGATVTSLTVGCREHARKLPPSEREEILREGDGFVMVVVPGAVLRMETDGRMGTDGSHPDLLEKSPGEKPLAPYEILAVRAEPAWRHADEPPHDVRVETFAIDRCEVTNGQYRKFLDWIRESRDHDRCHRDEPKGKDHTPRYWRVFNPLLEDPAYAKTAPFHLETFTADDKPVVGVDWFDAYACAAWAGKRLPREEEWELAARGTDGRRWPWGNEWQWGRCNTGGETKGKDVSTRGHEKDGYIYAAPVGSFPEGRSPFGCEDMAGNVAEWCADSYGSGRAVRGGSSRSSPSSVRCAARSSREPEFRTHTLGFRCAKDY